MTDKDYKEMIHSTIVPMGLPYVEQEIRYRPLAKFLQTETPERLYRFRCCKERHISEFEQDLLGFAPGIEMNDDFDAFGIMIGQISKAFGIDVEDNLAQIIPE